MVGLSRLLIDTGRAEEALRRLNEAHGLARQVGDEELLAGVVRLLGQARVQRADRATLDGLQEKAMEQLQAGRPAEALPLLAKWADIARTASADEELGMALYGLAHAHIRLLQPLLAAAAIREAITLATRCRRHELRSRLEQMKAENDDKVLRVDTEEQRLSEALARELDGAGRARLYICRAEEVVANDPFLGHHLADQALVLSRGVGAAAVQARAYALKATVVLCFEENALARQYAEQALGLSTAEELPELVGRMMNLLGLVDG